MIYFIQQGDDGPIKIGWSKDPDGRRAQLQCGHSENLGLVAVLDAAPEIEVALHKRFDPYRLRGEWFRPAPELVAILRALNDLDWVRSERDALQTEVDWLRRHTGCKCPVCS